MNRVVLQGGTVAASDGVREADVVVEDGVISHIGSAATISDAVVLDCSGSWVGPGLVDLHVHLREPGHEWKEDIASGSAAALRGGFTAVVAMPNTDPPIDSGHMARFVHERAAEQARVEVVAAGTITRDRAGRALAHIDELWAAGVRLFTDDGDGVADSGVLRMAMDYIAGRGGRIAQHCEDPGLSRLGHVNEGEVSALLGMLGSPPEAEEVMLARDLTLVRMTGCPYHVQHVSSAGSVELVARAKEEGLPVTAEVAPHHLVLDERAVLGTDSAFKMFPPLRHEKDVAALRDALRSGVIDAVATDHAPHADHEKDVPFEEAPRGVIGLETAIGATLEGTGIDAATLFDRMAIRPAAISGTFERSLLEVGVPGTITVVDPSRVVDASNTASKSRNTPFHSVTGGARHVLIGGRVALEGGEIK